MFLGQSPTLIQDDKKLVIPLDLVRQLPERFYLTQGFDRNILLLPEDVFENIYARCRALNLADPSARLLLRMILSNAIEAQMDKDGYLTIPDSLLLFSELKKKAVLVGQGSYLEIWEPGSWSKQELDIQNVESDPKRFSQFSITLG